MKNISIKDDSKLAEYFEIAKKAKALRAEAYKLENEAVKKFRVFYEKKREALIAEETNLNSELNASETEIKELIPLFCKQKGHTFSYRTVQTSWKEIGHTFAGSIYPTATYKTCVICGWSNDKGSITEQRAEQLAIGHRLQLGCKNARIPIQYNSAYKPDEVLNLIKQAIISENESAETAEWKKTGQRIIDLSEKTENEKAKLLQIKSQKEELCSLFGHDAELIDACSEEFKCKCCGKVLTYREYIDAHYAAQFKGGILEYSYTDNNPIIP